MTATVTQLPGSARSYYTVVKRGGKWAVQIVTPMKGMKSLRTTIVTASCRSAAVFYGRAQAAAALRPFKER